jgi:hypothetical protein
VQVNGKSVPVWIDELWINRDAVGILTSESLPIRQTASSGACSHAAANSIRKQIVVIGDRSTKAGQ